MGIWVKTGTRYERQREGGISHFLEHMLFKGTETRTSLQIAKEIDQVGGEFNAFTSREYTCFHILLLDRDAKLGLNILSDVVLNSTFNAEELERERKVILQEITMAEESPEELVHDIFFELVYGRHGLGRPILGSARSIRRMRRGGLMRFFRKHYRPERMVISVVGDVTHEMVKRNIKPLTKKNWSGRPVRQAVAELGFTPAPNQKHGRWWIERPTEQVHLVWGVKGLVYDSRDKYVALLLNVHLGGGMSSTLFQEIREKNGLAYTVYSSLSPFVDSGMFSIYAATSPTQVPLCLRLIEECVGSLRNKLLTDEELGRSKENLKGTILLSEDSVESRMFSIARNDIFLGQHLDPIEVCSSIDLVTPPDIRRLARKLFREHSERSLVALGPRPSRSMFAKLKMTRLKR